MQLDVPGEEESEDEDDDGDGGPGDPSETAILLTMEFTGFSRVQVCPRVCNQHDGCCVQPFESDTLAKVTTSDCALCVMTVGV